jgi:hypothetical protein
MNVVPHSSNAKKLDNQTTNQQKLTSVVRVSGHAITTTCSAPVSANIFKTEAQILQRYMLSRGLDNLFMADEVRNALSKVTGEDKIAIEMTLKKEANLEQVEKVLENTNAKLILTDTQNNRIVAKICAVTAVALKKAQLVQYFDKTAIA